MMKALLRDKKMGALVPATLIYNDEGQPIIRPALGLLNH